jgi:hypothetical protein
VVYSAASLNTPEWEKKFHDFFDSMLNNIILRRNIKVAHGEIAARVAWRTRDEPLLKKYLSASV